jgi:hypothetical protein
MELYLPEEDIFVAALSNSDDNHFFTLFENLTDKLKGTSLATTYKDLNLPTAVLDSYTGTYVSTEPQYASDSIKIYKEGDRLYCDLSNQTGRHMTLSAQSPTLFYLPAIKRVPTTIEFMLENGIVKGAYWTQEKKHELRKVK